jgi:hypothetical protein
VVDGLQLDFCEPRGFFRTKIWYAQSKKHGRGGSSNENFGESAKFLDEAEVAAWTGCLHYGLLTEEIGLKGKNFSPLSRQERQGKIDALVF